jgi:D-glycero-alpha-D-manno-heptose-7-phosphate kinase
MILTKTPLRVSLFGGGTDYPSFFKKNEGVILGGTINKHIYTSALPLFPMSKEILRLNYRQTESVHKYSDIQHPIVREWLARNPLDGKYGISTVSDIPGGTGLGSSSAFSVGFIDLIDALNNKFRSKEGLAQAAIHLEKDILGEPVGFQDQYHAAYGGFSRYVFSSDGTRVQNLAYNEKDFEYLSNSCYLIYTGSTRQASSVLSKQEDRNHSGRNDSYLLEMADIANEAFHFLQNISLDNSMVSIGKLLMRTWELKKHLSPEVENNHINKIVDDLLDSGCYGAKLLGAGAGGFVLGIGPVNLEEVIAKKVGCKNLIPFSFVNYGVRRIEVV